MPHRTGISSAETHITAQPARNYETASVHRGLYVFGDHSPSLDWIPGYQFVQVPVAFRAQRRRDGYGMAYIVKEIAENDALRAAVQLNQRTRRLQPIVGNHHVRPTALVLIQHGLRHAYFHI